MRIGIICPYSLSIPGGVQGQVQALARSYRAKGHSTRVLAPVDGALPDAGVIPLGVSVPTAANGSVAPIAPDPSAQMRLIRALRDEDFDVVHLHEPLTPGPTMTALMFKSAPMLGTFHAAGDSAGYKYAAPILKRLLRRLDDRVAVSPDAAKLAHRYLGGNYASGFNGIELDAYTNGETLTGKCPSIFFCGRHEPRKGLSVLLEAASGLGPDIEIWVGSDGPQTEELKTRFAHDRRIQWLGRITEEEKVARLRGADVYVAPALMGESFGVVLLEAMAAGTVVVASDLDGYRNVATHGQDALLVTPGDVDGFAAALKVALSDPGLTGDLIAAGRQRAAMFDMSRLADFYLERFGAIVK